MNRTKVVVFDFDKTLYNNVVYENWFNYCKRALCELVQEVPADVLYILEKQENIGDRKMIETLVKSGMSAKDWIDYRRNHLRTFDVSDAEAIDKNVLQDFASKYTLYIASHNQRFDIDRVAKALGIDFTLFKDVLTNSFDDGLFSKKYMYNKIIEKEKIKPEELFVIGDDFEHDIQPALEIGARGKLVLNCNFKFEDFDL